MSAVPFSFWKPAGAAFDPATLALTGWWRASYSASPWSPTASAGGSGSNGDLSEATFAPIGGVPVNSLTPASFNGVTSVLHAANNGSTYMSVAAYSGWALVNVASCGTDHTAIGDVWNNDGLFTSNASTLFGVGFCSSGKIGVYHYDGTDFDGIVLAATLAQWNLVQWKYDGTDLKMRINGGARSSIAKGNVATLAFGVDYGLGGTNEYANFDMLEFGFIDSALSDADEDNILSYARSRYALALT